MDRVTLHLCFGNYERLASFVVPNGDQVAGILDDLFDEFEHETERVFFRLNDNTLESILFYCDVDYNVRPEFRSNCKYVKVPDGHRIELVKEL